MWRRRMLCILLGLIVATTDPSQAEPKISSELTALLSEAPADDFISVVFILHPQIKFAEIYPLVKDLPQSARRHRVISELQMLAEAAQESMRKDLKELERFGRVRSIRSLWICNLVAAQVRARDILPFIGRHPEIARVRWDPPHPPGEIPGSVSPGGWSDHVDEISWGVRDINAPSVWDLGYRGQGVLIASFDTGVDYTHPDLADQIWVNPGEDLNGNGVVDSTDWNGIDNDLNGYVDDLRGWNFDYQSPEVMDNVGQGTATAGIILGNGNGGSSTGVAPEATMMVLCGFSNESSYWEAQQYAILMGADALTSSVSYRWYFNPRPDYATMRQNTEMELAAGLIRANSIGNDGDNLVDCPIPFNVSTPGNCPPPWLHPDQSIREGISSVMAVGAYDAEHVLKAMSSVGPSAWCLEDILSLDPNYPWWASWPAGYDDYPYSNALYQGLLKPDLAAPTEVLSTALGGGYAQYSDGTRAAAPHLGGAICLLLSAHPGAPPETLAQYLMNTAVDMGAPGKDNLWGCGRLDAYAAIAELLSGISGTLTGTVADTNTGEPVSGATISLPDTAMETHTDSSGHYVLPGVPEGIHDVRFTACGYDTLLVPDISFSIGVVETLSVSLAGPRIWVGIDAIAATLLWGDSLQTPVTVYNTGTSEMIVEFGKRGDWELYELFSVIETQTVTGDDQLFGVEVADGSIWVSGGNASAEPNKLYRFSFEGELQGTLDQPPSISHLGWRDLAWDGQYLYGSSGNLIEGIDLAGNLQEIISGPLDQHRALAYDPASDHFFACEEETNIVEFGRDGVVARSWGHDLHVSGLAWHPQDEDGCPLYIFSQDGEDALLRISKMDPDWGEIIFEIDLSGTSGEAAGGATISGELDPDRWCFVGLIQGPLDRVQTHSLGAYAPWLRVEPQGGTIPSGGTLEAIATLDAGSVPPGEYQINLVIEHNAPQDEIVIPVSLTVQPVGVEGPPLTAALPKEFAVLPVYPNPFNAEVVLPLELPQRSKIKIELFNVMGRNLGTIFEGIKNAGWPKIRFNASHLASGVYFYRITAEGLERGGRFTGVGKMLLLK